MRSERQPNRIGLHRPGDGHRPRDVAHLQNLRTVEHARHARIRVARRPLEDLVHGLLGRILHLQLEEEPIELRFRERIRALHLERVLRGEHEKRLLELIGRLADRDADVLHRFEQRRLRLRRGAVDFVGQDDVREDRAGLELEERPAVRVLLDDVGADDVGRHQVGRELDARELQVEDVRERVHEAGLADAGDALEQHVAAGEQAGDRAVDDVFMPDDSPSDLVGDSEEAFAELVDGLCDGGWRHGLRVK